jgi:nucleotide-binding universal stress UspA family protein
MAHGTAHRQPQATGVNEPRSSRDPRILLAVDLTPASRDAADEAIKRARDEGAELIVLSVVEQHNLHLPGGGTRRVDQERDRLTAGAQAIVRQARDAGVRATFLIWEGDPAEAILDASRSEDADVIVLGSRPRLNVRRLILGSVSSEVAKRATCDVIVVPS